MINQIKTTYSLLGLFKAKTGEFLGQKEEDIIPAEIQQLADQMQSARLEKNYAKADEMRAEINNKGYNVAITKGGVIITKK